VNCPVGTYEDGKGGLESTLGAVCKDCPANRYGVVLYDSEGDVKPATSAAQCAECPAPTTTGGLTGAISMTSCNCPKDLYYQTVETTDETSTVVCVDCINGADCSARDGITVPELVALPGYWRPDPLSLVFSPCSVGFQGTGEEKQSE
jgi:hypothetical protein